MIFVDRSVPRRVVRAIQVVRTDVKWLEDIEGFGPETPDEEWLAAVGANGWPVLTRDKKIRTRPGERGAIIEHGVGCFVSMQNRPLTTGTTYA